MITGFKVSGSQLGGGGVTCPLSIKLLKNFYFNEKQLSGSATLVPDWLNRKQQTGKGYQPLLEREGHQISERERGA